MRNITVPVDEETYRQSRIRAAELDTSVSTLVRGFLERLVRDRTGGRSGFRAADNLGRDALHDRYAVR